MSILKNYSAITNWYVKQISLHKGIQRYSKFLNPQNLLNRHIEDIKKCNDDPTRYYSNEKSEKNIANSCAEDMSNNDKLQKEDSADKLRGKKATVSVAVIGGGCALSTIILLKQNPAIKEIRLIDTDTSLGPSVADLKQIDTTAKIRHYKRNYIVDGLRNVNIVVLMDETDLTVANKGLFSQFISSSKFIKHTAECMANACPHALVVVFTYPVTAIVPLISEIYKKSNIYNPSKIIGSVALQAMRINALTANFLDLNPSCTKVPITGGADSLTLVPLWSKTTPFDNLTAENQRVLIQHFRSADHYLSETESQGPSLSMGLAAAKFISTLVCGVQNIDNNVIIANAFVRSNIYPSCKYLTSKIQFGPNGIQQIFDLPKVSPNEVSLIEKSVPVVNQIVESVKYFVRTGNVK